MLNYKLIEEDQKPIDETDRIMINISYDVMLSPGYSVFRKKLALDVLAKFVNYKHHRDRIQVLHDREVNKEIKQILSDILEGKFVNWVEEYTADRFGLETKSAKQAQNTQIKETNRTESIRIGSMLPFYRYQAKHSQPEELDDDFDY